MRKTQAESILDLIRRNNAKGTENWKLVEISLKYSSRISELRKDGHDIYSVRTKTNGKPTGTWLYFIREGNPENSRLFELETPRGYH